MKFYLAGRFDRLDELNAYAEELRRLGHIVDCRWLQGLHQLHLGAANVESADGSVPIEGRLFAQDDVEDLAASDAIVFFSERPDSHSKRGGRHVEFGMAIALRKRLFVIGPRENVFHCLPQVEQFADWEGFQTFLAHFFTLAKLEGR